MKKHTYTEDKKAHIRGMIRAFKGAKKHLVSSYGVCYAICQWRNEAFAFHSQDAARAKRLVARALGNHVWLESWLYERGHEPSSAELFKLRKQWLDQLIADCEAAL